MLVAVVLTFLTGLFGAILEKFPIILALHRASSIALVFFLAIHIFKFHKKLW